MLQLRQEVFSKVQGIQQQQVWFGEVVVLVRLLNGQRPVVIRSSADVAKLAA